MPKEILFTQEPTITNSKITYNEDTCAVDISHEELTGYEILEFININKDIVDYDKQHKKSLEQHEIKVTDWTVFTDSRGKELSLTEWIAVSKLPIADFKYHHYIMVVKNEDSLDFGNLSIQELLKEEEEEEDSNRYFFSGPFMKGLLEKYKPDAVLSFGLSKSNNDSIGIKITSGSDEVGYYDISYGPPYGNPAIIG